MQQLPQIVRLLICSLLIGGYGAMYTGSIAHDLGHLTAGGKHSRQHSSGKQALLATEDVRHLEVDCFFCTHAPVVAGDETHDQIWSPAATTLISLPELGHAVLASPVPLAELRGPPAI